MRPLRNVVGRLGRWTLVAPFAYMACISCLSHIPGGEQRLPLFGIPFVLNPSIGNLLHLPLYYILGALWKLAFDARGVPSRTSSFLTCFLGTAFAGLDEIHQSFVPMRSMDFRDVLTDLAGLALACLTWRRVRPLFFEPPAAPVGEPIAPAGGGA